MKYFGINTAVSIASVSAFFLASYARAYDLLVPLPLNNGQVVTSTDFGQYISGGYQFAIVGTGICAVVMIVWGGFDYVLTDSISGKGEGRKKITSALIGLLLALSSYAILYTINPNLVTFGDTRSIFPPIK